MKKTTIIIEIIVAVVILGLAVFLFWPKTVPAPVQNNNNPPVVVLADIEVTSPVANATVSSPLTVTGLVRGNGWAGFEGQVGTVKLFDQNNNQLAFGILTATTDWMQLPTQFSVTLTFNPGAATTGTLVFKNENPSGDPVKDKTFVVPVSF